MIERKTGKNTPYYQVAINVTGLKSKIEHAIALEEERKKVKCREASIIKEALTIGLNSIINRSAVSETIEMNKRSSGISTEEMKMLTATLTLHGEELCHSIK
jgi:hypothetical protein